MKKKESNSDSNNIRPITISDSLGNVFEQFLLLRIQEKIVDPEQQFGFKSNSSTNHAIYVLDETVIH
jgi:hypothetical protein